MLPPLIVLSGGHRPVGVVEEVSTRLVFDGLLGPPIEDLLGEGVEELMGDPAEWLPTSRDGWMVCSTIEVAKGELSLRV